MLTLSLSNTFYSLNTLTSVLCGTEIFGLGNDGITSFNNYSLDPTNPWPKLIVIDDIIPLNAGYPNSLLATTTLAYPFSGACWIFKNSILFITVSLKSPNNANPTALGVSLLVNE